MDPTGTEVPTDPGAVLFDEDSPFREVDFGLSSEAIAALLADPTLWVAADLTVDGRIYEEVGVTLKGNGSFQPMNEKPSFKISTDRFNPDLEIDGLDDLVLNNMVGDPSMMAERVAYQVYRDAGVPSPRAVHATVTVNEQAYGLYTLVEAVDGRFLKRWFEDGQGSLYEMFDVDFLAEDVWHFDHDGGPDDRAPLFAVAEALASGGRLTEVAGDLVDLEDFATYFAVSSFVGQFDAYPYSFPGDDVYVYVDPADGRVRFIPHGADETFVDDDRPADYVFGALATACLDDPACAEDWQREVARMGDLSAASGHLVTAQTWAAEISSATLDDPRKPYADETVHVRQEHLQDFIAGRAVRLQEMLGL